MGKWEADSKLMLDAQNALFNNRFEEGEELFRQGAVDWTLGRASRDLGGAFAVFYAVTPLLKGTRVVGYTEINETIERLKVFEVRGNPDVTGLWIGNKISKIIATCLMGATQILQNASMKGVSTMLSTLSQIEAIEKEGLSYNGLEKSFVRSGTLFVLGLTTVLSSTFTAEFVKSMAYEAYTEQGTKRGIEYLQQCFKEGGTLAPIAAVVLLLYIEDIREILNDFVSSGEIDAARDLSESLSKQYPISSVFLSFRSDIHALEKNVQKAEAILLENEEAMNGFLPSKWEYHFRSGLYKWAELSWSEAGEYFQRALTVYLNRDEPELVPLSAALTMLCYLQKKVDEDDKAWDMAEIVEGYRIRKDFGKRVWNSFDIYAFKLTQRYFENGRRIDGSVAGAWPLLDIALFMVLHSRLTFWMRDARITEVITLLLSEEKERGAEQPIDADEKSRLALVLMSFNLQLKKYSEVLKFYQQGLEVNPKLKKTKEGALSGTGFGSIFYMHLLAAKAYQKSQARGGAECLQLIKDYNKRYTLHPLVALNAEVAKRGIGEPRAETDMNEMEVPPGKAMTLSIPIDHYKKEHIMWNWTSKNYDVSFMVRIEEEGKMTTKLSLEKARFNIGTVFMSEIPEECMIHLTWDNTSSVFRSKKIRYKVEPLPPMITRWGAKPHVET